MKKILCSAVMLAMLASCAKVVPGGNNEIKLSAKALKIESKGAYNETTPTATNPLEVFVIGSRVTNDFVTANQHVSGVMSFSSATAVGFKTVTTGTKQYPAAKAPVYMIGFHPSTGWADAATGTATFVMTGTQDIMTAPQISTTSEDVAAGGTVKGFAFDHKLTMLEVRIVVDGAQTVADAWGVLKSITLPGQFNNTATVTMADNTIAFTNPVTDWKFYTALDAEFIAQTFALPLSGVAAGAADNAALLNASKVAGYTLVAPITAVAATKAFDIKIVTGPTGDETKNVTTTVPIILKDNADADFAGSTAGYKFSVLLVFKASDIKATASVTAWKAAGTSTIPIE